MYTRAFHHARVPEPPTRTTANLRRDLQRCRNRCRNRFRAPIDTSSRRRHSVPQESVFTGCSPGGNDFDTSSRSPHVDDPCPQTPEMDRRGCPARRHSRRAGQCERRRNPRLTEQARHRVVLGVGRHAGERRGRRRQRNPVVQRIRGHPVVPGRPRCRDLGQPDRDQLGGRLREGVHDSVLYRRHQLHAGLRDDHRDRRPAEHHGLRHRALRPGQPDATRP